MGNACAPRSNRVLDISTTVQQSQRSTTSRTESGLVNREVSASVQQRHSQSDTETSGNHTHITSNDIGTSIQSLQWERTPVELFTAQTALTTDRALSVMTVLSVESRKDGGTSPISDFQPPPVQTEDRAVSAIGFSENYANRISSARSVKYSDGYPSNNFEMVIKLSRELENVVTRQGGEGHGLCKFMHMSDIILFESLDKFC